MTNQEAIETLQSIYPTKREIFSGEYPQVADAIDLAVDALKQPPANWTPCSVALPEAGKQVLVTAQWGDEEPEVFSAGMNPITGAWEQSDGEEISRAYTVIVWQPLPEPYRGEA